jgi:transcriptional regulator with PAS, ATPase and Fis domain
MRRLFEVLPAISSSPSTVLISGETGTGKELLARTIHNLSGRKDRPFVAVNCGALPDSLLESELFGYKAGAFTGARKDKPGRFSLARGGTIFLDEIGEISPALQVRVLQERTYEPLGGVCSEEADARVIVATNKDLDGQVEKGIFREDLFYRVNVVRVELPPLRKRKEDIPLLVEQFINRFNHHQQRRVTGIDPEAISLLMAHNWPGNIRELANVIERAFILCRTGLIEIAHLPTELTSHYMKITERTDLGSAHAALDEQAILAALERNSYNRLAASRDLGIHKTTLYRRMKKLGMELPDQDGRTRSSS